MEALGWFGKCETSSYLGGFGFFRIDCITTVTAQGCTPLHLGHEEKWPNLSLLFPHKDLPSHHNLIYMDIVGLSLLAACSARLRGCSQNVLQLFELSAILLLNYLVYSERHCVLKGTVFQTLVIKSYSWCFYLFKTHLLFFSVPVWSIWLHNDHYC